MDEIISKFRYILDLHVYCLSLILDQSEPVLGPWSFPVLALTKWKDLDRSPRSTGPGPVQSIGPMQSLGLDLKALLGGVLVGITTGLTTASCYDFS